MRLPPDPDRQHRAPHRLRGWGTVHVQGSGRIELQLRGTGSLEVRRLRTTAFRFEGRGARRFPDPNRLLVSAAQGRLVLEGSDLDATIRRGHADVRLRGVFRVLVDGRGEWLSPTGTRKGWGLEPRVLDLRTVASSRGA